jgi:tetratricopeptide (TPR) repeat protein
MSVDKKRVLIIAVPMAIGVATILILNGLNSGSSKRANESATKTTESQTAPPNPAHERAALEEQLKKNPDHAPILLRLAELEREAGNIAGAIPYLRQVLDKDPKNLDARLELGRALYETNDIAGALKETQRLLADHHGQVDGLYNLGAIYANQNKPDLARQYWMQAVKQDPQSDSGKRAKDGLAKLSN